MSKVGVGALLAALAGVGGTAIGVPVAAVARPAHGESPQGQPVLATSILSVRRVPDWLAGTAASQRLGTTLKAVVGQSLTSGGLPSGCLMVTQGDSTVFGSFADDMFIPASNLKILTATAVLDRLSGSDKFVTSVSAASPPAGGVVYGNLYLVGGGDPDLRTSSYGGGTGGDGPTFTSLDKLAEQVRESGVTEVTGSVIGDGGRYDDQRVVPSWKPIYTTEGDVGPLSALEVNDGFVPNTTTTTVPGAPTPPTTKPPAGNETSNSAALAFAAATDPVEQAAQAFATLLRKDGVRVDGGARSGLAPGTTTVVTSIQSAPLADEVDSMLNVSDDTAAELFTKELGYQQTKRGTTAAGVAAIRDDLQADGLPVNELVQVDGSGLDRGDRASCNLIVQALRRAGPTGTLAKGLPVAGKTGTLEYRMMGTPAQGRLIAKTGSLDNVVSLSGFVLPASAKPPTPALGQPLVFSLILNGLPDTVAQEVADRVGVALAGYPNLPAMKLLEPQTAG